MTKNKLPKLVLTPIKAGFPNPAQDVGYKGLDLHSLVIQNPAATFLMKVDGSSMEGLGIFSDDIVVIDKSLEPKSGDVVVAYVDGEFTLKQFMHLGNKGELRPANPAFPVIDITDHTDFQIWGVVTYTIHHFRGRNLHLRTDQFRRKVL